MESNRDEAERALSIAQRKWQAGDSPGALKFARKSHSLYPTDKASQLIERYTKDPPVTTKEEQETGQPTWQSSSGNGDGGGGETLRQRKPAGSAVKTDPNKGGGEKRAYSEKQVLAVKEVMRVKDDYYRVLGLESKAASEAEIKKAYRKAALVFHPDKNTAPGADEAFKLVAHAFTVLSDADKRAHYDRFGVGTGASSSAGYGGSGTAGYPGGMHRGSGGFAQYDDDGISAEDLFNMFFGGDLGQFGVQFGPNVRFAGQNHRVYTQRQREQRGQRGSYGRAQGDGDQEDGGVLRACMQFLPIVVLIMSFFATSLVSLFLGGEQTPSYSFERSYGLSKPVVTANHGVKYWVNEREFSRYVQQPGMRNRLEREVEASYVSVMQNKCIQQRRAKRDRIYMAQGWFFGLGGDPERLREAQEIPLPACDEVRRMT